MRKVAVRRDVHKERTRGSGRGTGDEVCPLAGGQLVAGRVAAAICGCRELSACLLFD